jgi:hypothetical protein
LLAGRSQEGRPGGHAARCRRKGSITLEVSLILPILIVVILAAIQYAVFTTVEQAIVHAATVAAREAGKGASISDLSCIVETELAPHGIRIGNYASVVLEDPEATPAVQTAGATVCTPAQSPTPVAGEVRVTVCVDMGVKPFLNALKYIGINNTGKRFGISSLARKEPELEFP